MFTVKMNYYYCDFCQQRITKTFGSLDDLWQYLMCLWKNKYYNTSLKPQGIIKLNDGKEYGFISLSAVLPPKFGFSFGDVWIEQIDYNNTTIFDKQYTSPKLMEYMKTHNIADIDKKFYGDF